MLPFDLGELFRFGVSAQTARLLLLRRTQSRSFRAADGIIFFTRYAHDAVLRGGARLCGKVTIIPHGIDAPVSGSPGRNGRSMNIRETRPIAAHLCFNCRRV